MNRREKRVLPGIELGTFCTPGHFITTPRETHSEKVDSI